MVFMTWQGMCVNGSMAGIYHILVMISHQSIIRGLIGYFVEVPMLLLYIVILEPPLDMPLFRRSLQEGTTGTAHSIMAYVVLKTLKDILPESYSIPMRLYMRVGIPKRKEICQRVENGRQRDVF